MSTTTANRPQYRAMQFGVTRVQLRDGVPGTRYMRAEPELHPYAPTMGERLVHWATTAPDRTLFARRATLADGNTGDWVHLSFAQALSALAQALEQVKIFYGFPAGSAGESGDRQPGCGGADCARIDRGRDGQVATR